MRTSKNSSSHAKNGIDRNNGIAHYESLITLEKSKENSDSVLIKRYQAIISNLKKKIEDEKKK